MKLVRYGLMFCCVWIVWGGMSIAQDDEPNTIRVAASWTGAEGEGFQIVLDAFTDETGIDVIYEADTLLVENVLDSDYLSDPADIVLLPRPGVVRQLAINSYLVPLDDPDDPILDQDLLDDTLNEEFIRLGQFDGRQYGVMVTSRSKSTVWYKPESFEELELDIPETWDDWKIIAQTFVDEGRVPFALGGGDGWTLTDWFENIFIRMHGSEAYQQLFTTGETPWDDPQVIQAFARISGMLLPANERLASGEASILEVGYRDSIESWLNGDAEMYYEGGFVSIYAEEIFPDLTCGEDYSFFMFPEINAEYGTPIIGGGEMAVVFNDNSATREFMNYIASAEGATVWVTADTGAIISPNRQVAIESYDDPCSAMEAEQIRATTVFAFDGSDLLPGILGEYAFFTALQDYLIDPEAVVQILEFLEFSVIKS